MPFRQPERSGTGAGLLCVVGTGLPIARQHTDQVSGFRVLYVARWLLGSRRRSLGQRLLLAAGKPHVAARVVVPVAGFHVAVYVRGAVWLRAVDLKVVETVRQVVVRPGQRIGRSAQIVGESSARSALAWVRISAESCAFE